MPLSTSLLMFIHLSIHLDIFIHFIHTTSFGPLGPWNWTEFYSFYKIFTFNIFGTWANIATENCGGLRPFLEFEPCSWKRPLNSARGHTPAARGTPGLKCFAWPKWYFLKWEIPHKLGFQDLFFFKKQERKSEDLVMQSRYFLLLAVPSSWVMAQHFEGHSAWEATCRHSHSQHLALLCFCLVRVHVRLGSAMLLFPISVHLLLHTSIFPWGQRLHCPYCYIPRAQHSARPTWDRGSPSPVE